MKLIYNAKVILADRIINNGAVLFSNKIEKIYSIPEKKNKDLELIDAKGAYLSPGFIDIHTHGFAGSDTMEGTRESLENMSRGLVKKGVTSFLPTTMTMESSKIKKAFTNIKRMRDEGIKGARILGAHMEGPFINAEYKGAQSVDNIKNADLDLISDYYDLIKIVTIAPEIDGAKEFIKEITAKGIVVATAHTAATYEKIKEAEGWGLTHVSHLFNAMTSLHHRRPGVVGAALTSDKLSTEIIADYIHIHPAVLKLLTQIKDSSKIILVTDAMEAAGLEDGEYSLGGQKVYVKNGEARLEDGTIAGSVLTMDKAVKNMLNATNLAVNEVINMATINPAKKLNLDHKIGSIKEGLRADLILLNKNFEVERVFVNGKVKRGDFYL